MMEFVVSVLLTAQAGILLWHIRNIFFVGGTR